MPGKYHSLLSSGSQAQHFTVSPSQRVACPTPGGDARDVWTRPHQPAALWVVVCVICVHRPVEEACVKYRCTDEVECFIGQR